MNYRHAFHAGNFADLVKHAALLAVLARMTRGPGPLTVIDTHAGRGLYDLGGAEAQRSGEAAAGIGQLMRAKDLPEAFAPLRSAVTALNGGGETRFYPGSPLLIADALRAGDSYLGCELRDEEHSALAQALKGRAGVRTACVDGYREAAAKTPAQGQVLVLIDPPFERPDDYARIVETLSAVARRNPRAVVLVWLPIKDLETFDGFLREAEEAGAGPLTVAEARMRPLADPMKMNGCALVLARAPDKLEPTLEAICGWTVQTLGDRGQARVWRTG
ncbi:MAG TPA: 23S rRNA (adenine(2030)-N(6))-methyltransferase RlmJ [Phenylobacterium sp.]|nr:23S rRNA (adenine(2030)-N(6))-methyltransferase RlmJ [Phenylobacterium sp.]